MGCQNSQIESSTRYRIIPTGQITQYVIQDRIRLRPKSHGKILRAPQALSLFNPHRAIVFQQPMCKQTHVHESLPPVPSYAGLISSTGVP